METTFEDASFFSRLSKVRKWNSTPTGLSIAADGATVLIDILQPDVFRIEVIPDDRPCAAPQFSVSADVKAMAAPFQIRHCENGIHLETGAMRVSVDLAQLRIQAFRPDGSPILTVGNESFFGNYAYLNDSFVVSRSRETSDLVLGLGERTGSLDRNGRKYLMWNVDVLSPGALAEVGRCRTDGGAECDQKSTSFDPYYVSIPFYQVVDQAGRAAGFFIDNVGRASYDFSAKGEAQIVFDGGRYIEYVFAGPKLERIIEAYTFLTGRVSPPPMWSLGYQHCRWHPYHQDDVVEIAATYRRKGIPCDAMWLDIDHMDGYRVFTWNPVLYPDPAGMLDCLASKGFRAVTIIDPGVKSEPGYEVYDSGLEAGFFCRTEEGAVYTGQVWPGKTAFPDFVLPEARKWWGRLNAQHVESGLAGIWNDMNEPATGSVPSKAMRFGNGRFSHNAYHNAYGMLMAMGTVEGLRQAMPESRPFVLSRSGCAGIQRYAATWLGDNMSRWDHLAMSLPMSLGLGLSGQPFIGADIGGFGENCEPELLVRWMQLATLTPFCRNHNDAGGIDQYPWSFGPKVEVLCREAIRLRYRLAPYLYTCFVDSSETGAPIMLPLFMDEPGSPALRKVEDEFLYGDSLLVAPVLVKGKRSRKVVFPHGDWYDWWTGDTHRNSLTRKAPLDCLPLFARAGKVIPLWPEAPDSADGYYPATIELRVFPLLEDGESTSRLVEDDGRTFDYLHGARLETRITQVRRGTDIDLRFETAGAPFPGWRRTHFRLVFPATTGIADVVIEAPIGQSSHCVQLST